MASGKAMAKALAQAGAELVCAARTLVQIEETVQEIRAAGGQAMAVPTDVTDSAQVNQLIDACLDAYGKIDIMVANAGGGGGSRGNWEFWEYPDEAFEEVLATNLKSNFYCNRAAARHMVARGAGGVIINVASGTALRGNRHFAYPTAKGGVISLTKSVATILGPHKIRANAIIPGFVLKGPPADAREAEVVRQRGQMVPVRRLGEWWELGPLCRVPGVRCLAVHHRAELHHRRRRPRWRASDPRVLCHGIRLKTDGGHDGHHCGAF